MTVTPTLNQAVWTREISERNVHHDRLMLIHTHVCGELSIDVLYARCVPSLILS